MSYLIHIQNEQQYAIDNNTLRQAADIILDMHETPHDASLSIVITDNEAVHALNLQYRAVDAPTDVLSFPAEMPALEAAGPYLGDLIIAYPYAKAQAESAGHKLMDSLALLVIHGTLHLLGYDHDTDKNRAEMWAVQAQALEGMGISTAIVPALEDTHHGE